MTMQNNESSGSSYFQGLSGQVLAFGVAVVVGGACCLRVLNGANISQN